MSWLGVAPEPLSLKSGASFDVRGCSDARACCLSGIDAEVLSSAFRFISDEKTRSGFSTYVLLIRCSLNRSIAATLGKTVSAEDGVAPAVSVILNELKGSKPPNARNSFPVRPPQLITITPTAASDVKTSDRLELWALRLAVPSS